MPVQMHLLTLRYSGGMAAHGLMPIGSTEMAVRGAASIMSGTANFYTSGFLEIHARQDRFELLESVPHAGSIIREIAIGIASSAVYDIGKETFPTVLMAVVAAGVAMLAQKDRDWFIELGEKLVGYPVDRVDDRIEPSFPTPSSRPNQWPPTYTPEGIFQDERRPLRSPDRVHHPLTLKAATAIESIAKPITRNDADELEVSIDADRLFRIRAIKERPGLIDRTYAETAREIDRLRKLRRTSGG